MFPGNRWDDQDFCLGGTVNCSEAKGEHTDGGPSQLLHGGKSEAPRAEAPGQVNRPFSQEDGGVCSARGWEPANNYL